MNEKFAIKVTNLRKQYGELEAVKGISFTVERGEIFSLLGPNGAGKSTTISILSGLVSASGGEAAILGHPVSGNSLAARALLGLVPQDIALYPDLTARENLLFWGRMYGLKGALLNQRVNGVLDLIGINGRQHGKINTFSGGMKRRVNIGAALLHNPQVVIMDEPTVGIDPQSRRYILDGVKELNRQGVTVLYTTHYMEEAEELSDHIAIMDHGQIIASGTHAELIRLVGEEARLELVVSGNVDSVVNAWKTVEGVSRVDHVDGLVSVMATDSNQALPRLFDTANRLSARITSVDIQEPNLEMVFLQLTGRALRD